MKTLNYKVLEEIGYTGYIKKEAPEKVLQFGEGNFLRAFADCFFDCANENANWNGKVVVVQPRGTEHADTINEQEGLYTLYLQGSEKGNKVAQKRIISVAGRCISAVRDFEELLRTACQDEMEYIVSNTTEAGIKKKDN